MKAVISADLEGGIELCHGVRLALEAAAIRHADTDIDPQHLRLMLDCAQICETTADFMTRQSPYHSYLCEVCAAVCEACAETCLLFDGMEECAEACRECTAACRQLADWS